MNYIFDLFKVVPLAVFISSAIYMAIFYIGKSKRGKPTKTIMVAEFLLIGWCVMLIYVTQVMSFGQGMGELINFTPLHPFYIAIKYGATNAGFIKQIFLNMVMFVPIGFLLPIVFPKMCKNFLPILVITFAVTFCTECFQLLTGRSADIDDIIANTFGGLIGFSLYVFYQGIYYYYIGKKQGKTIELNNFPTKVILSVLLFLFTVSPYMVLKILNDKNEVGFVYYGHFQPENIQISGTVSDKESTAIVYKNIQKESLDELQDRLKASTGFTADFMDTNGVSRCINGESERIFISEYNTWNVTYDYGQRRDVDSTKLPNEAESVALAYQYLEKFGIDADVVEYQDIVEENYSHGNLRLIFKSIENKDSNLIIWGNIEVTIGENGKLLGISDNRTWNEFYKEVKTISPKKSLQIAQDVGVGKIEGAANVLAVEPSYYLNKDTGYLIPTWQIIGQLKNTNGESYDWRPTIDARK